MGNKQLLPSGYTRLEYLEATGSQTIKMNGLFDQHTGLRLEAETFEGSGNTSCVSFMTQNPSAETYWWVFPPRANRENTSLWEWYWFKKFGSFTGFQLATRYVATINYRSENKVTIEQNGTVAAKELPETLVYSSPELNVINSGWKGRCYSVQVSRNTALENNFVPALDETGRPCMFDLVTRTPFHNTGTGQFTVGMTLAQVRGLRLPAGGGELTLSLPHEASIDKLAQAALEKARANGWVLTLQYAEAEVPAGYRKLAFLESTGTQYINTGYSVTGASAFSARFAVMGSPNMYNTWGLLGCLEAWKVNMFGFVVDAQKLQLRYNGAVYNAFVPEPGRVYSTSFEDGAWRIDEELKATIPVVPEMEVSAPFGLFCYIGSAGTPMNGRFPTRIYHVTLLATDGMHEFIPALDPTGAPCMYDKVTGTMKENAGSGAFIAGLATVADVRSLWLPETRGELTVSVPADTPDSAVAQLRKNNPTWQIAIQYRQ